MTDYSALLKPDQGQAAHSLHLIDSKRFEDWLKTQPERCRAALSAQKFIGKGLDFAILPGENPDDWAAVLGVANVENLSSWCLAKAAEALPEGTYRVEDIQPGSAMLGWLTAQYRFDRYRDLNGSAGPRILLVEDVKRIDETVRLAEATALVRDLVNTPTAAMGPPDLQTAAERMAKEFGAKVDRKSTRLNSSHKCATRMPSSA